LDTPAGKGWPGGGCYWQLDPVYAFAGWAPPTPTIEVRADMAALLERHHLFGGFAGVTADQAASGPRERREAGLWIASITQAAVHRSARNPADR